MGFTPHSVIIMTSRRIVDSHFHIFDISVRNSFPHQNSSHGFPGEDQVEINRPHTIEEAETTLASSGIKTGVFVQCYNDCPEEMDWVFSQAEKHTFLKGVVGGLDLTKHDKMKAAIAKFSQNKRPKFVGVRHLIDFEDNDFLTRPDVHAGLQILSDNNLTFDLQSYPPTIQHIPLIAAKFPKLKMVIDHIAKPNYVQNGFEQWAKDMVESFKPYVHHCLAVFGVSRCMFGSDWPVCKLAQPFADYKKVVKLLEDLTEHLTEEEKNLILFQNVIDFYKLDGVE